jgi:hypothetical protein
MIKRIGFCLGLVSCLFLNRFSYAAWGDEFMLGRSSFTSTNDTLVAVSTGGVNPNPILLTGGVFDGVVIASNSSNGIATFYDSIGSATKEIGFVSMNGTSSGSNYISFEVRLSSGLTYTTTGNSGISIIYKITKPF